MQPNIVVASAAETRLLRRDGSLDRDDLNRFADDPAEDVRTRLALLIEELDEGRWCFLATKSRPRLFSQRL